MLTILDRYILRRYLGTFFFMILLLAMLAAVIDFSEKVDDFTDPKGPEISETIFDYYLNFIPFIISLLFPLCALISVIFFTSRLAGQSEIIAMIGGGTSFYRLLRPYMIGAAVIAGLHFVGNHYLFPASNKVRTQFENTYIWKHNFQGPTDNIHLFLTPNSELYIKQFQRRDSVGRSVMLIDYDDSTRTQIVRVTSARQLSLKQAPNLWQLRDYKVRLVEGMNERLYSGRELDTILSLEMSDLVRRDNFKECMNTPELKEFIDKQIRRGSAVSIPFQVELHRRTAYPFSIFILTLIGVSVAARKTRGGMGWHLVLGMGLSALYIFALQFTTTFSTNAGFAPWLGAWLPNMLFAGVAAFLMFRAQK